jgi:hypothetical protein
MSSRSCLMTCAWHELLLCDRGCMLNLPPLKDLKVSLVEPGKCRRQLQVSVEQ